MKKTILTGLSIISCAGLLSARTWTSSDGSKTFEADYISHTDTQVTVMKGTKELTFTLDILSEDDQSWTKEQVPTEPEEEVEAVKTGPGEITATLNKYLEKFDGRRYKKHTPEAVTEYYLVYYSASW